MASPKTHKVWFKDGKEARVVMLTPSNHLAILNWIPNSEYRERVSKKGQASEQRVMLNVNGSKLMRAAYFGDWIIKTDSGFQVIKFDKIHTTVFFPNAFSPVKVMDEFKKWEKLVD